MARQMQRTRTVSKPAEEHIEEHPERSDRADEVSEQAECCLADIDAVVEEACCLLAEAADMLSLTDVAESDPTKESAPTPEEFTATRQRLKDAYWRTDPDTSEEAEALAALKAYEQKWPQYDYLCTC